MSMAVFMQWAAKEKFFLSVFLSTVSIGVFVLIANPSAVEDISVKHRAICFETATAVISEVESEVCSIGDFTLGSQPLTEILNDSGTVTEINPLLFSRFNAAKLTAEREGVHLYIASGFRTYERQGQLFAEEVEKRGSETEAAKWVLPAQYSHHPEGLAIDVNYPGDPVGAKWLESNGARFGLCRVYANEWWHFEGVIAPGDKCPAMAPNALVDLPR
jgi:hypothetical protein